MSRTLAEKIATLPPWAREHIAGLDKRIAELVRPEREKPKTRVIVDPYADRHGDGVPLYIDPKKTIRFVMPNKKSKDEHFIDVTIVSTEHAMYADADGAVLRLQSDPSLVVSPGGGNSIYVRTKGHWE